MFFNRNKNKQNDSESESAGKPSVQSEGVIFALNSDGSPLSPEQQEIVERLAEEVRQQHRKASEKRESELREETDKALRAGDPEWGIHEPDELALQVVGFTQGAHHGVQPWIVDPVAAFAFALHTMLKRGLDGAVSHQIAHDLLDAMLSARPEEDRPRTMDERKDAHEAVCKPAKAAYESIIPAIIEEKANALVQAIQSGDKSVIERIVRSMMEGNS